MQSNKEIMMAFLLATVVAIVTLWAIDVHYTALLETVRG